MKIRKKLLRKNVLWKKYFLSQNKQTNKKPQKRDGPNPRTNRENKAIQRKSHTKEYTYTLTKRGKGEKIIYPAPKLHLLNLGWFVVYSDIQQMQVHQVVCGALMHFFWGCWESFPFLFFVRTAPGVQLWIWTHLCV